MISINKASPGVLVLQISLLKKSLSGAKKKKIQNPRSGGQCLYWTKQHDVVFHVQCIIGMRTW